MEQARRLSLGVLAPEKLWEEREDVRRGLMRAALSEDGAAAGAMTPEALRAEMDAIDALVMRRRPVS